MPTLSTSPYRDLLDFAERIYREELAHSLERMGKNRQARDVWGKAFEAKRDKLQAIWSQCLLAAEPTGYPVPEVERLASIIVDACCNMLLWQQKAPLFTEEKKKEMEAAGTWREPVPDYLREQYNRILAVHQSVVALAVRADACQSAGVRSKSSEPRKLEPNVKGKVGRRGYPLNALNYARELRRKNPLMKSSTLRRECLKKFSDDDLPPDGESFRRWLNRHRA